MTGPPIDYLVECPMGHREHRTLWGVPDAEDHPRWFTECRWCGQRIVTVERLEWPT